MTRVNAFLNVSQWPRASTAVGNPAAAAARVSDSAFSKCAHDNWRRAKSRYKTDKSYYAWGSPPTATDSRSTIISFNIFVHFARVVTDFGLPRGEAIEHAKYTFSDSAFRFIWV